MIIDHLKSILGSEKSLEGRNIPMETASHHFVNGESLHAPFPNGCKSIQLGMGCFWGAERLLWQQKGVHVTAVGYSGGKTPNPTYQEVCSGQTGHAETVLVVFNPEILSLGDLLKVFFENHDPTQGMRQGNDIGTQYRSVIYVENEADLQLAQHVAQLYGQALEEAGKDKLTTEINLAPTFYYAETYHQQYLAKNPSGYCGIGGNGVCLPPSRIA